MADELVAGTATASPAEQSSSSSNEDVVFDQSSGVDSDLDNYDYLGEGDDEVVMDGLITDDSDKPTDMTDAVDKKTEEVKPDKPEKPELTEQDIQYQKILKLMEDPKIIEAIKAVQAGKEVPQQQAPQPAPTDEIKFTEEELADPQTFGKSIINKIQSKLQEIQDAFNKQIEPLRNEYGKMMFEKECASLVKDFGDEAKPFVNKNTKEFEALKDKFLSNPTLTLRDAFLLVRPTAVNKMVEKGVSSAIDRGREQSLRVNGNRTPMSAAPKTNMTAYEAVLQAFKDNGIAV